MGFGGYLSTNNPTALFRDTSSSHTHVEVLSEVDALRSNKLFGVSVLLPIERHYKAACFFQNDGIPTI